jgi:pimeloyl-ACP methyl ester carboxylesterase
LPLDPKTNVYYEVHGSGEPLFLSFPIMPSQGDFMGRWGEALLLGFLERLRDRYAVLIADYPSIGKSGAIAPEDLTAARVSRDLLGVAAAAGFDRFALWAYSWGAAAALQVAARTDRLTALAIGGWPVLDAPYAEILRASRSNIGNVPASSLAVLRSADQYRQWATFYASLEGWDERAAAARIRVPRLAYFGEQGDTDSGDVLLPIASICRAGRQAAEVLGWEIVEIPGQEHAGGLDPAVVVPVVRPFLDRALPRA